MRAIERRLNRLEGATMGETLVIVSVPYDWPDERKQEEATALALAAGGKLPFSFIFVIEHFGEGGSTEARLMSFDGRMCK